MGFVKVASAHVLEDGKVNHVMSALLSQDVSMDPAPSPGNATVSRDGQDPSVMLLRVLKDPVLQDGLGPTALTA